jgi:hypothetical protein
MRPCDPTDWIQGGAQSTANAHEKEDKMRDFIVFFDNCKHLEGGLGEGVVRVVL